LKKLKFKLYLISRRIIMKVLKFNFKEKSYLKLLFALIVILAFSGGAMFATDVNVIMKDGSFIKGSLLGKTSSEIVVQEAGGKVDTIKITDIKGVFDAENGNPVDLSVNPPIREQNVTPNRVVVYRPKEVVINGPQNAIGIDFLALALGSVRISYERALSDWFSIRIDGTYSPNYYWYSGVNYWSAAVYARFYLNHALRWYHTIYNGLGGPFFEFGVGAEGGSINYSYSDPNGTYNISGTFQPAPMARFIIGNKFVFGIQNGLYLEPYIGAEISFGSWSYTYSGTGYYTYEPSDIFPYTEGLGGVFLGGIDFGYAF
jgi:hypothetical protein